MLKKIFFALGILVVIFGIGTFVLFSKFDMILSSQIEKYGSRATRTNVTVTGLKLSVTSGQGSISGLKVGSPEGCTAPYTISLDNISVTVDTDSITGDGPIIVKEIIADKPQINYEILANGNNNLKTLARNAQEYAGSSEHSADKQVAAVKGHPERKVIIKKILIRQGQVEISQPMLKLPLTTRLPDITLTDIGDSNGTSPDKIAEQVLTAITNGAARAAGSSLGKQVSDQLKNGDVKDIGKKLKGMFGQ